MSGSLIKWITTLICAMGAINWGTTIFFGLDLIKFIDAKVPLRSLDRALYAAVAISGFYVLLTLFSFA